MPKRGNTGDKTIVPEVEKQEEFETKKVIDDLLGKISTGRKYFAEWGMRFYEGIDANRIVDELLSIGDKFTPKQIVDKARDPNTELHKCFEWNDSIAAEKYRIRQASAVVHSIKIAYIDTKTNTTKVTPIRMFSMPEKRNGSYAPTEVILKQVDQYQMLLNKALDELRAFKTRYKSLSELQEVFDAIDAL